MDDARCLEAHHELGRLGVEAPQLRRGHRVVDGVPQKLVAEVVVAVVDVLERVEDRRILELLEHRLKLHQRAIDHAGEHIRPEAAPDHRSGVGDQARVL